MDDFGIIGGGVLCGGVLFFILGFLAMSRQFLLTGNICMIIGILVYLRPNKAMSFVTGKDTINGIGIFVVGFILILLRHSFIGAVVELIGSYWFAGGILNIITSILSLIPGVSLFMPSRYKDKEYSLG